MSNDIDSMVRWHRGRRTGFRVSITLAREDHVIGVETARRLHYALGRALDEIDEQPPDSEAP